MTLDPDKYAESLFDAGAKQAAPMLVAAAVDALVGDKGLKWSLPQMWNDKVHGYATHWRVLGLTKKRLVVVSAWSPDDLWTWDPDEADKSGQGNLTEAWTRPLADIEALICDDPNIMPVGRQAGIETSPAYSIKLRGRNTALPVSARVVPRPEDHTAAAEFVDYVLSRWP